MAELDLSGLWASDETRRIDLIPDGSLWVEIKDELDHGDEQAMQAAAMKGITRQQVQSAIDSGDQETQDVILMDSARLHFLKLAFYLVDWNLKDEQGRGITLPTRVDDRVRILKRLKPAVGMKISDAIDKLRDEKAKETAPNDGAPLPMTPSSSETAPTASRNGKTMPSGATQPTEATS